MMLHLSGAMLAGYGLLAAGCGFGLNTYLSARRPKRSNEATLVKEQIGKCLEGMEAHVGRVMAQAHVEEAPFPHLVVENFFPEAFYQHACQMWPTSEEFAGARNAQRRVLPVTYGCLEATQLPKGQKVFWRLFGEVIINRYLKPQLAEKFKPYLHQKLGLQEKWHTFDPYRDTCNLRQDCLIVDKDCPNMLPHVDQLNMLAQIMIYFPTDNNHEEMGTVFYHGDPSSTPNSLYEIKAPDTITFAKKVPYKRNTLVVFIQSPTAWHGYERPACVDPIYERRVFLSPLFFSPEFMERTYCGIYARTLVDEYFFDHRFLQKKNWINVWGDED